MDSLHKKTLIGSIWMMLERFGYLSIQFISNLVLARLLAPNDFGTIGIMMVFISLSHVFIDSGFSASLIQRREISDIDKSTVFFTNLFLAILVYSLLFICSPWIADYFHIEQLGLLFRALGIVLLIDAFCAIQNTILIRDMNFKRLTQIKLGAIIIAASVAIILAYNGLGIWALVVQYILYSLIRTVTTWVVSKWKPLITFNRNSFKTLFNYGSKLLFQSFVAQLYVNLQQIIIGRFYTPTDLGYYSQARQFQQIPSDAVTQVINNVAFPAYAKLQDDRTQLRQMFRQNVRLVAYVNTPIMVLLASVARPLIILFYSSKWIGSIDYFQFLCIGYGILYATHGCSLSVLKAVGRSNYVFRLEIIKTVLGILFIIVGLNVLGIWGLLYALALNTFTELFLNGYYVKKEINYSGINQLMDIMPPLIVSIVSGVIANLIWSNIYPVGYELFAVIIGGLSFTIIYFLGSFIGNLYGFGILINAINKTVTRIRK